MDKYYGEVAIKKVQSLKFKWYNFKRYMKRSYLSKGLREVREDLSLGSTGKCKGPETGRLVGSEHNKKTAAS